MERKIRLTIEIYCYSPRASQKPSKNIKIKSLTSAIRFSYQSTPPIKHKVAQPFITSERLKLKLASKGQEIHELVRIQRQVHIYGQKNKLKSIKIKFFKKVGARNSEEYQKWVYLQRLKHRSLKLKQSLVRLLDPTWRGRPSNN